MELADFLISAKDYACAVAGVEPEKRFQKYLAEQNITTYKSISDISTFSEYNIGTLFHALERIKDPIAFLSNISSMLMRNVKSTHKTCTIEVPHANDALLTLYNNEKFSQFTYWSCHLYLFYRGYA